MNQVLLNSLDLPSNVPIDFHHAPRLTQHASPAWWICSHQYSPVEVCFKLEDALDIEVEIPKSHIPPTLAWYELICGMVMKYALEVVPRGRGLEENHFPYSAMFNLPWLVFCTWVELQRQLCSWKQVLMVLILLTHMLPLTTSLIF